MGDGSGVEPASPVRAGQTVIDIACEVGFNSTFSAAFAKAAGTTPSDHRRGVAVAQPVTGQAACG